MAEVDILMQEKQDDGSYNKLYPITNASNVNYTNSSLSGVSNAQQGLDSIVNTLGNINLNNYFTKTQTLTSSTAALFGLGTDAVPDDVLALLSKAAIKKTYATKKTLSDVSEGDVVWVIEGDTPAEYYVAKHNYESGLNGTGKTLLLRKEVHSLQPWDSAKSTVFETSSIFQYLNSTFKNTLDPDVRNAITPVKFYCTIGGGNNSVSTITGSIFLASATEMGIDSTPSRFNAEGTEFPVANTLRPFDAYNYVYNAWTRSPTISKGNVSAITQNYSGFTNVNLEGVTENLCIRQCFALPSTFSVYVDKPVTGLYDVSDNLLLKLPGVQIATGSYMGTGKYGSSNPNSLTFDFVPKLIFFTGYEHNINFDIRTLSPFSSGMTYIIPSTLTTEYTNYYGPYLGRGSSTYVYAKKSADGKTVQWYNTQGADNQLNQGVVNGGQTQYHYIAIG